MRKRIFVLIQYLIPQHLLSICLGKLADCTHTNLKNWMIKRFIKAYRVDMSEAAIEDPTAYPTFNDFFIRQLKPDARPISGDANSAACPADGTVAELGSIHHNQLLQAKNSYFNLETLLGNDSATAQQFYDGSFATIYLAPNNYHRVHIPCDARLVKTIYIPGKLFSVNRMTTDLIPNLYGRNERFVALFETANGPMAVILVGALIVGSMQMAWMQQPMRAKEIIFDSLKAPINFKKGDELGYFKLGSTVVVLFGKDAMNWNTDLNTGTPVKVGQNVGDFLGANFALSKAL